MTANQLALFQQSTGVSGDSLILGIASVGALVFLSFGAWLAYRQLQHWQMGQISFYELSALLIRTAVVGNKTLPAFYHTSHIPVGRAVVGLLGEVIIVSLLNKEFYGYFQA